MARISGLRATAARWCLAVLTFVALAWQGPAGLDRHGSSGPGELRAQAVDTARIVAVGGSITEIIYALGLEKRLVGIDTTSLFPADALSRTANVGYMRALSAEGILSLRPSAVLAIAGSGPPAVLKLVAEAGVPIVSVPDDPTPEGVAAKIETIGRIMDASGRAQPLAAAVRARFGLLAAARTRIVKPVRVLFLLTLQNGKPMVAGRGSAADAMIRLAGAINAADAMEGYKQMTDEAVVAAAPEVILSMANGHLVGSSAEIFALPAFAATPAAAAHRYVAMDGLYLLGFGPRTPDAARDLMAALYPELALPPLPAP